ncbi:hypothetical protein J6590_008644 [Homalodisca vitripennis]|nr:hypothetical protein J6590_008644 [Homalodisca vitripennis]
MDNLPRRGHNEQRWMFWKRRRHLVTFLAFLGFFTVNILRVNFFNAINPMITPYNVTLDNGTVVEMTYRILKKEQKDLAASIELCHTNISDVKQLVTKQDSKITACEDELVRVNVESQRLWKELKSTKQELRDLEQYSHRNNLII